MERIQTAIGCGGQAGLAARYCLTALGHEHIVIAIRNHCPRARFSSSAVPSFVGMPRMPSLKTGTLAGVGEAPTHIAGHIVGGA